MGMGLASVVQEEGDLVKYFQLMYLIVSQQFEQE